MLFGPAKNQLEILRESRGLYRAHRYYIMEGRADNSIVVELDTENLQHETVGDSQAPANLTGARSKKKPAKKRKANSWVSVPAKAKVDWSANSTQLFLDMYEDIYFNHCNRGNVSQDQWRVFAGRFNDATNISPPVEVEQMRNKFDSLYKRYKSEKHKQGQTGAEPSSWELYDQMHMIKGDHLRNKGKMNLMNQMLELKRMELEILRNDQRGPPS
ncbi:hypothetical protein R1sor_018116 [Riccia sorocarpa]|uniref:Myb/SANT-like DNA-binding domain-containing protein n=1 Tax=Riccia sorocarpa TaxID=122646 RepID=A0ABD3IC24_9MARC